jgi:tripartite ATP-independent transporter DctM subunit
MARTGKSPLGPQELEELVVQAEAGTEDVNPFVSPTVSILLRILEPLVLIAVVVELGVSFGNVVTRTLMGFSLNWSMEVAELCLTVIAFIGGAIALPRNLHTSVHAGVDRVSEHLRPYLYCAGDWLVTLVAGLVFYFSLSTVQTAATEESPILGISEAWFSIALPVGMLAIIVFAGDRILHYPRRVVALSGLGVVAAALLLLAVTSIAPETISAMALWITILLMVVMLFLGTPIGFVLALASFVFIHVSGDRAYSAVPLGMEGGVGSFVLLAIPFFIVAGLLMTEGGLTQYLIRVVRAFVGHRRGGLLYVVVVVMYVFAGISGSKAADVAAVGAASKDMLAQGGYSREEGVAVVSGATIMGETIPPSLPMLVLGSVTTLSIGKLFLAGLLPAVFIGLFLMGLIFVRARRHHFPIAPKAPWHERRIASLKAVPVLLIPVILIGGIVLGIATPTEASSVAVIYTLVLLVITRRRIGTMLVKSTVDAAAIGGMVLFIVSASTPFSQALTVGGVPQALANALAKVGNSPAPFLLLSIVALVIMGELLEGLPAVLVFAPILVPLAPAAGVDPLHYAIVILFAMGIGSFGPPIGVGLYVACAIFETKMERAVRPFLPYLAVLMVGLIVLAFVPQVTLWLPGLRG